MAVVQEAHASQEAVAQKLFQFVLQQMRAGQDRQAIAGRLQAMGMEPIDSRQAVEAIHGEIIKAAEAQQVTSRSVFAGALGGILGGVAVGIVWALIVRFTGYEIGFVAWALGLAAGLGVVIFARGRRGRVLQGVAVLASLVGIAAAKYLIFVHFLRQTILERYGVEAAGRVSLLSARVVQVFFTAMTSVLSGYDVLWVILAVATAWRIPQGLGIKLPRRERGMMA